MLKNDSENNLLTPEEIKNAKSYIKDYIQSTCLYIPNPNVQYHPAFPVGRIPTKIDGNPGGMAFLFLLRRALYHPKVANLIYLLFIDEIIGLRRQNILPEDFQIGGIEASSIALLSGLQQTMMMLNMKTPNIITVKKERKSYGLFQFADGEVGTGPILFMDDIIHSGSSFYNFANIIEFELHLKILPVCFCILSFHEEEPYKLKVSDTEEFDVKYLFKVDEFDFSYNQENEETLGDDILWKKYSGWSVIDQPL